jgi:hypothetical protein
MSQDLWQDLDWLYIGIVKHMHMAIMWRPSDGLATVSAELGHLQRPECVIIIGSVSMAPTASLSPLHSVADALACRLKGIGLWPGRGSEVGHTQIPTWLMDPHSVFYMSQDKMVPITAFVTPFKVETLSCELRSWTWYMTLWSTGLVWYTHRSGWLAGVCMG